MKYDTSPQSSGVKYDGLPLSSKIKYEYEQQKNSKKQSINLEKEGILRLAS